MPSNKYSKEFKDEVAAYAQTTTTWLAAKKYSLREPLVGYWANPKVKDKMKQRSKDNWQIKSQDPEFIKWWNEKSKADRALNPEIYKTRDAVYRDKNREKLRAYKRKHRLDNLEHYNKIMKAVFERDQMTGRNAERRRDPIFQLKRGIRSDAIRILEYGYMAEGTPIFKYLGCDLEFFYSYIENLFKPGMTFKNRGRTHLLGERAWHLDHKLPLALLKDDASEEMLAKLCHYTNHQPLWEDENLEKSDNLDWEDAELSIIEEEIYSGNFHPSLLND